MNIYCLAIKYVDAIIFIVSLDHHGHLVHVRLGSAFLV